MTDLLPIMSVTKWRRLLDAISHLPLPVSFWKFIGSSREFQRPRPQPDEIINNNAIGDTSALGPFHFHQVESVRWPSQYELGFEDSATSNIVFQPLEELAVAIKDAGQFAINHTESNLILLAYKRIG